MTTLRLHSIILLTAVALALFALTAPALATDFGNPKDIKQIRTAVTAKFGEVLNVSASNDWALCTAYDKKNESDLSVVLRRTGEKWKIVQSDGGAFDRSALKSLGVPASAIPFLLKAYQ